MQYENRQPTEGVNVSKEHPLKRFGQLLLSAAVLVVMLVVVFQFLGGAIARMVPLSYEVAAVEKIEIPLGDNAAHPEIASYLIDLANRLLPHLDVPEDVEIAVHYGHDDVFNAFATLGGNVLFYRGLLDQMPHENALAMVVAHEISHVLHRDPISGLGGGMASSLALSVVLGNTGAAGDMLQTTGVLTGIQFTRKMETAADTRAVAAVNALYGHVNGADELFRAISVMRGGSDSSSEWLERFTSTHPLDEDRIRAVLELAERQGWDVEGELTPLPTDYETWLQ